LLCLLDFEQDVFPYKMDYQTARYAAECARWYAASGDESYKEKAYRSLNFVTYCSDPDGKAYESILSNGISNWWSDCYGEGPRMFYRAFAAIPAWSPPGEDHILYSESILKDVRYKQKTVSYATEEETAIDYLHLGFKPSSVTLNGKELAEKNPTALQGYLLKAIGHGDFSLQIHRQEKGRVLISGQ
jgi:hypothetical protein